MTSGPRGHGTAERVQRKGVDDAVVEDPRAERRGHGERREAVRGRRRERLRPRAHPERPICARPRTPACVISATRQAPHHDHTDIRLSEISDTETHEHPPPRTIYRT